MGTSNKECHRKAIITTKLQYELRLKKQTNPKTWNNSKNCNIALVKMVAEDIRLIIPRNSYTCMAQWIKALVRSSDIPRECEFNT